MRTCLRSLIAGLFNAEFLSLVPLALGAMWAAPVGAQCGGYSMAIAGAASIVPGTSDIGNHCDDCTTNLPLPFPVSMYGTSYTAVRVSSNGTVQFTTNTDTYGNNCLPRSELGVAICPHWDDLRTDGPNEGIFQSISGSAPNRVLSLEWRGRYYSGGGPVNFEVRFFEDNSRFEIIFGVVGEGGSSATVGVQDVSRPPTQYSCNAGGMIAPGTKLTFACSGGPMATGSAFPNTVYACGNQGATLLRVSVTPGTSPPSTGITVLADLSSIGGSASQPFFDDGSHGDVTRGDNVWSFGHTVPELTPPGDKVVVYSVADAQGRATSGVMGLKTNPCASTGPDVIVVGLAGINYYGAVGNVSAYAIGTNACNRGDVPVLWIQGGTQHPLIAQNMYRLKGGRFEQIGQSFLKHSFQSLNSPGCATCVQPPMGGAQLGVGCSDVYGAGYNGSQGNLGPRSTVNATTGVFSWPPPAPAGDLIGQRLQVYTSDIDPALNQGALYFAEAHYVTADDAQWINPFNPGAPASNGLNNASYQRITIDSTTAFPQAVDSPHAMSPAIQAWKDVDPGVSIAVADYVDMSLGGPGIACRFWVAAKATDNGDGTWHYEYAAFNLNADRAGGSFSVPLPAGVLARNIGFHGVFAHSGEPYPNTASNPDPWAGVAGGGRVTWTCPEPYLPPNGDNAIARRWGTMYNFRFDADVAPTQGAATVGLFKPGTPTQAMASGLPTPGVRPCRADFDGDGTVDFFDYDAFVTCFEGGACPPGRTADFDGDGSVDFFDYDAFVVAFEVGC